ncbi:MAG: RNA polymerase sigma factor, partial [Moorea sp. SIO4G2]|nr:RNA polymerase sigma factor [Moorena sp. SIO4G2]
GKLVENSELLEVIRSALEDLPENQREVCILHFEQELSYQEIAQRLDISNNTVRKRIQRAREKLQQLLQTYLAGLDQKAYGEIVFLKKIRRVSEQKTREEKDRESYVTPADKEIQQEDLETTDQLESLKKMGRSGNRKIVNKGNYLEIKLETAAEEITSLVEPKSVVPKVIPIEKAPNPPSTMLTNSNPCPMDWVKQRSLKAMVISPPSLGHGSIEVPRAKDISGVAQLKYECGIVWFWASPLNPPLQKSEASANSPTGALDP